MSVAEPVKPQRQQWNALESHIEELIGAIRRLQIENRVLRERQDILASERAALLRQSERARQRIETMIARLRALERGDR